MDSRASLLGLLDACRTPLAFLFRRRFEQIVPLGYNCETAFRFYRKWGFLDASLFAWSSIPAFSRFIPVLADLDCLGRGKMEFSPHSMMWACGESGVWFHGRMKPPHRPSQEEIDADLADLLGRIRHLRKKFISYATNEKTTLFIFKPRPDDCASPDFNDNLDALERTLEELGARNWKLLVICEKDRLPGMRKGPNRIFRTLRRFAPNNCVTNPECGDPAGWNLIFTEFAPAKVLKKAHAFKFE